VISICVAFGMGTGIDQYGNKSYVAFYECRDGRTIERSGNRSLPGLIRDPSG
jgi:hypothetical protein